MKILQVHNYYQLPGGEDVVFSAEQKLLSGNGHKVLPFKGYTARLLGMNKAVAASQAVWPFTSKQKISKTLRQNDIAIAHFHNIFPLISPSAYWACRNLRVPVVQTLHHFRLLCPGATLCRDGDVCEECIGKTLA